MSGGGQVREDLRSSQRGPMKRPVALGLLVLASATMLSCGKQSEAPRTGPASAAQVAGRVLEQLDSPPYTFLRLATDAGDAWVAVPIARVNAQKLVRVTNAVPLRNFEIGPGRTVPIVYLGTLQQ